MLLSSVTSAARLELEVVGYQFPELPGGQPRAGAGGERDWDANWLLVHGTAGTTDGASWGFREPCLTTWEALALADWLDQLAADRSAARGLSFIEPDLELGWATDGDQYVVTVGLAYGSGRPGEPGAYELVLALVPDTVRTAAREWRHSIQRWPPR